MEILWKLRIYIWAIIIKLIDLEYLNIQNIVFLTNEIF